MSVDSELCLVREFSVFQFLGIAPHDRSAALLFHCLLDDGRHVVESDSLVRGIGRGHDNDQQPGSEEGPHANSVQADPEYFLKDLD
jgi:hypothetical protein